jgi:hypothetical protein
MTGKEQAKLLGLFMWLLTGLQILIIALIGVFYAFVFGMVIVNSPRRANDPPPEMFAGILIVVMVVLLGMTLLFSVPKIVAGYGLRNEKSWAKAWAIVACVMACMSFPFGTAVGVYGLVFIFGDKGKAYFDNPSFGSFNPQSVPPPPPNSWQS